MSHLISCLSVYVEFAKFIPKMKISRTPVVFFFFVFSSVASNNAGVMATPFTLSKDGIELQFAINHIGMANLILCKINSENLHKMSKLDSLVIGLFVLVQGIFF